MVIIVTLLLLINIPFFNAMGEYDSLNVVLSVRPLDDDYPYEVNDEVIVEVRVFDKGQLTDPDNPPQVTLNKEGSNPREISVTISDTGYYTGTFIILETDLENDNVFEIEAYATLGKDNVIDKRYDDSSMTWSFYVDREIDLDLKIEIDGDSSLFIERSPGDVIDFKATVENNHVAVNPDNFMLTVDDVPIIYSNPDVGVFKASYTVDSSLEEDTIIFMVTEAEYKDDFISTYNEIRVNFYTVWYHEIEISETAANFELYVSDMDGGVVTGADINLDYHSYVDSGSLSGTTDSQGKVTFTIDHNDVYLIYFHGSVEKSGKTQNINGNIQITDRHGPTNIYDKFWVDRQTDAKNIEPGDSVTLDYIGYNELEPLDNQTIYYYIYSQEKSIDNGSTVTDSVGNFALNVAIPGDVNGIILEFESPFEPEQWGDIGEGWEVWGIDSDDNLTYMEYSDSIIFWDMIYDDDIQIEAESFNIHDIATISASTSGSYYTIPVAFVAPGEYSLDEDSYESPRFDWVPWPGEYLGSAFFLFYNQEEDNFYREFLLPEFFPKDETYTIIVFFRESSVVIHWNYIYITPGDNDGAENEEPDNDFSNLFSNDSGIPGIALILGILLLLTLFIYIGLKRKRKEEQE